MSDTNGETPRRLRTADLIRWMDNQTQRQPSEPSASVELSRNAKGETQMTVKVYATAHADPKDVEKATGAAYDQAVQAYEAARAAYPFAG